MAYQRWGQSAPEKDTGWGLIFRLNRILDKIELACETGNYDRWNLLMDRIFVNITYKNPAEIIKNDKGEIIDINLTKEDVHIFGAFNARIRDCKRDLLNQKREGNLMQIKIIQNRLYNLYVKKDTYVRKKMFEQKIYLKETEQRHGPAIYSGY